MAMSAAFFEMERLDAENKELRQSIDKLTDENVTLRRINAKLLRNERTSERLREEHALREAKMVRKRAK